MHSLFEFVAHTQMMIYLVVIGFMGAFVAFWQLAIAPAAARVPAERREGVAAAVRRLVDAVAGFLLPQDVYYYQGHTWVKPEGGDIVKVGIDDFAQKLIGPIEGAELPRVGASIKQGEKGFKVIADSKPVELLSPVDGMVVAVNTKVLESPDKVNRDPYGEGWLFKVRAPRFKANRAGLLSGDLARKWMEEVSQKLMTRLAPAAGTVALDAGPAQSGIARELAGDEWVDLAKEFLLTE